MLVVPERPDGEFVLAQPAAKRVIDIKIIGINLMNENLGALK
jgi:hypothetical protein